MGEKKKVEAPKPGPGQISYVGRKKVVGPPLPKEEAKEAKPPAPKGGKKD